ncbi:hypothetical protein V6N12_026788 [Hibiscus sabdariffa]|uniref:Uncharacterized protein n=1 Tax=Hibiscus sabdariffa TaxID=183260 RepID=A0ABR2DSS1_9ROSI
MLSKGDKCVTNARHCEGIMASSTAQHIKFTVVDTSLLHGGKSSRVRELRYLPVKVEISSESNSSGGNDNNSSNGSFNEHEQKTADRDRLSSHGPVAADTKPSSEPVAVDNVMKGEGKYENDISNQDLKNSCTADQNLSIHQEKKTETSEDARSKRIIKHHFSRRAKSSPSVSLATPEKRKKLTACISKEGSCLTENLAAVSINIASPTKRQKLTASAKTEGSDIAENISSNPVNLIPPMKRHKLNVCTKTVESHVTETFSAGINEQMGVCRASNSQDEGSNDVLDASHFQEKVLFLSSTAEGNPECAETSRGSNEKLPSMSSIGSDPPLFAPDSRNDEPVCAEADGSQFSIVNSYTDSSETTINVCAEEQRAIVNPRRQSKRSRPLTTRVLEALESGFFNVKKTQRVRDVQAPAIQFSSPSRRARGRVKVSKHASVAVKTADANEGKDPEGAFISSNDIMDQPPQVAH